MQLKPYTEIIGCLHKIKNEKNKLKLEFRITTEIEIPKDAIEEKNLAELVGKRVGVFNGGDGNYKIRRISSKKQREAPYGRSQ